ncbi:MAG TPA: PQ-loop repeat-containing protein [Armatimonadota bacterium]|nr:PQ-loop repeat-containing protein [Armatimonadota bacterium]
MPHLMGLIDWKDISLAGLICVEISYLPQIVRLYRVKEAHEFHILYPMLNILGRVLVLAGGLALHRIDIEVGMFVGIVVRFTLLGQVWYYHAREARHRRLRLEQVTL